MFFDTQKPTFLGFLRGMIVCHRVLENTPKKGRGKNTRFGGFPRNSRHLRGLFSVQTRSLFGPKMALFWTSPGGGSLAGVPGYPDLGSRSGGPDPGVWESEGTDAVGHSSHPLPALKGPIKGEGLVYPLPPAYLCLLYIPPTSSYSIPLDNVVLS